HFLPSSSSFVPHPESPPFPTRRSSDLRLSSKKCRQPFVLVWIDESICPAFAHAHQIGNCNCSVIQPERKRCAVKIASGNHLTTFGEHKRIIGRRCGFN